MSLSTYDQLKTAIADWLDDASVDSFIPDMITLAEINIRDRLNIMEGQVRKTATVATDSRFLALPDDFENMVKLKLNTTPVRVLRGVSPVQLGERQQSASGKPNFYTIVDSQIEFDRVPDSSYTAEMIYNQFAALSDSNQTNNILTRYPNIYLYESLLAGGGFVDEEDSRFAKWEKQLEKSYAIAERAQKRKKYNGSMLRARTDISHP